nr:MAG TPA: hypothetical protein [Bacteriophage sp.]
MLFKPKYSKASSIVSSLDLSFASSILSLKISSATIL